MKNLKKDPGAVTTPTEQEQEVIVGGGAVDLGTRTRDDPHMDLEQVKRQRGKRRVGPGDPPQGLV
jgi:hypothetical protein